MLPTGGNHHGKFIEFFAICKTFLVVFFIIIKYSAFLYELIFSYCRCLQIMAHPKVLSSTFFNLSSIQCNHINAVFFLTSSLLHPKIFIKEFSYFLMPCHQHCLGVNLLVQRQLNLFGCNGLSQWPCLRFISVMFMLHKRHVYNLQVMMLGLQTCFAKDVKTSKREHFYPNFA